MNYGLYLSANGALSSMHRQDVLANNLANMHTVGFKPDAVYMQQRLPERVESPNAMADPQWMLERLGGGHQPMPTRVCLAQGMLTASGGNLDLAIEGEGFFVISDERGQPARLTRDGRFTLNARGELVMAANGLRVLDETDRPIRLDPTTPVRIDEHGVIRQNGGEVARLRLVRPLDETKLVKVGDNLMRLRDESGASLRPASGRLRQGFTEASAVDPILTMNAMMAAAKAAQANLTMMQYQDNLLGQSFNTFGRVA